MSMRIHHRLLTDTDQSVRNIFFAIFLIVNSFNVPVIESILILIMKTRSDLGLLYIVFRARTD